METLTWAEYFRLGEGLIRRREAESLAAWERTRWQTWQLVNIQLKPEDRLASPADLLRLASDRPRAATPARPVETPEEMIARLKRLDPDKFPQHG